MGDATHHSFNYQILIECVRVPGTVLDAGEEQWAQQGPYPHGAYTRKPTTEPQFLCPLCELCPSNSTKKETCSAVERSRNHLFGMPRGFPPTFPRSSQETFTQKLLSLPVRRQALFMFFGCSFVHTVNSVFFLST